MTTGEGSAMDYKEKYEAALEKAKKFDEKYGGGYAAYIFPELAESEDERIRKEIISIVKEYGRICEKEGDPCCTIGDCLAYLEKQKEQNPIDYDHEMWKNCEANFEGGKKEVINNPEKYGLQKPAEWNEEDENVIETLIRELRLNAQFEVAVRKLGLDYVQTLTVLDKCRRLCPQPKQEWSEEDEVNFKWFDKLFRAESVVIGGKDIPQDKYLWFKSLRPSWKPSEEQMGCLERLIYFKNPEPEDIKGCEELYEHLKR